MADSVKYMNQILAILKDEFGILPKHNHQKTQSIIVVNVDIKANIKMRNHYIE